MRLSCCRSLQKITAVLWQAEAASLNSRESDICYYRRATDAMLQLYKPQIVKFANEILSADDLRLSVADVATWHREHLRGASWH